MDDMRSTHEVELSESNQRLRLAQESALSHVRAVKVHQASEALETIYSSDKENQTK